MKRVLVIAYYFPPMGLSGVQRVAGFVRHLPAYGWMPTVLTVEPAGYFAYDESLLAEIQAAGIRVIRTRSLDPTRLFRKRSVVTMPKETTRRRLSWISEFAFVPDNKVGWMPFAISAGARELKDSHYEAILASGPPYTAHIIGSRLSKRFGLPLIVDFRDDWVGNPRHHYPTPWHRARHVRLERTVIGQSTTAVTINEHIRDSIQHRNPDSSVKVIPHGHDITSPRRPNVRADGKLQLLYTGVFYDVQTPDHFLRALRAFIAAFPAAEHTIEAIFAGVVPESSRKLIDHLGLSKAVRLLGYLPHDEILNLQSQADILWMTIGTRPGSAGISTGKLSEYIGQCKPILALVQEGAAKETLKRYQAAVFAPPEDVKAITTALTELYACWAEGTLPKPNTAFAKSLSRLSLTQQLAQALDMCLDEA